jgi:hypothetical protein
MCFYPDPFVNTVLLPTPTRGAVDDARESARRTADDTRRATDDTARDAR